MTRYKGIAFAAGVLLVVGSTPLWLMYVANGIAYGSIVGLPGRDTDLRTFGFRAEAFLMAAILVQTIGIGLVARNFILRLPTVAESIALRLSLPLIIGLLSAAFVFVIIRGL